MIHINDVDLDIYQGLDLYSDVRSLASQARLASYYEGNKHKCLAIYLIELKKASSIQLTVASINRSQDDTGVSQLETELSLWAATNWANNLIINPSSQPMSSSLQNTSRNHFYLSSLHQSTPNSPKFRTRSSKPPPTTSQPTPNSPMSCRPRTRSQTSKATNITSPKELTDKITYLRTKQSIPKRITPKASPTSSSRPRRRLLTSPPRDSFYLLPSEAPSLPRTLRMRST
ncbi:hypothetical protein Cgig2_021596 [Carnegiea gigantea]|uniref:Uncharacterized protein n=1 Tax=Carnegiea gigantea TaxID=171969 RepID=A0A9Q1GJB6_9CARY|nr:hypothetical protein Cgig2_021596 [Carnegiea gigantea]